MHEREFRAQRRPKLDEKQRKGRRDISSEITFAGEKDVNRENQPRKLRKQPMRNQAQDPRSRLTFIAKNQKKNQKPSGGT